MKIKQLIKSDIVNWGEFIQSHSSLELDDMPYWYQKKWDAKNNVAYPGAYAYTFITTKKELSNEHHTLLDNFFFDELLKFPNEKVKTAFIDVSFTLCHYQYDFQIITIAFNPDHSVRKITDEPNMYELLPYDKPTTENEQVMTKEDQSHQLQVEYEIGPPPPVVDDFYSEIYAPIAIPPEPQPVKIYSSYYDDGDSMKKYSGGWSKKFTWDTDELDIFATTPSKKKKSAKKLTNREKGLLTLLVEKINQFGMELGAHLNKNWTTNQKSDVDDSSFIEQGVLDRIEKIEYVHTTDQLNQQMHTIEVFWREPFGKGLETLPANAVSSMYVVDPVGKYHHVRDKSMRLRLYAKDQQSVFEGVRNTKKLCHWRPIYDYDRGEVCSALKLMAKTFDWLFFDVTAKEKKNTKWATKPDPYTNASFGGNTFTFSATYS